MRKRNIYILFEPFKQLSQADAEDLFEEIIQHTGGKIDMPKYIEVWLLMKTLG